MHLEIKKVFIVVLSLVGFVFASNSFADEAAFKVFGKTINSSEVSKRDQSAFYEIEKKKFDLIQRYAEETYLDQYWTNLGKEKGKTADVARREYLSSNVKVSTKEVEETLKRFKDHPQLSKLPAADQKKQVEDYLRDRDTRDLVQVIIGTGIKKGELVLLYPQPSEPVFDIKVSKKDHVRYGPNDSDIKPMGCKGDACKITVVEYSEFQCPFCAKVLPDVKRLLTDYKGKIRWIVRDFPLSFHDRAKPAAIAAKCASQQGKYWEMYTQLFDNQRALGDADISKYADNIKLNKSKFEDCIKKPAVAEKLIDENTRSGAKLGVTGTPAFFINGRRLSGAIPYNEFKKVIDSELTKKKG